MNETIPRHAVWLDGAGAISRIRAWESSLGHACPQFTTSGSNVNVARKDCSPVYVPYPIGGPKSPLPAGANTNVPLPISQLGLLPPLQTPYPALQPLPGQSAPYDPLGCSGPDLSFVNKGILAPVLGKPYGSDPADPYNCSGKTPFYLKVLGQGTWRAKLDRVTRGGLTLSPEPSLTTVKIPKGTKFQEPATAKVIPGVFPYNGRPVTPGLLPPKTLPAPGPAPTPSPVGPPVGVPPVGLPPLPVPPVKPPPVKPPPVKPPPVCVVGICIPGPPVLPPVPVPPVPVPPVCVAGICV